MIEIDVENIVKFFGKYSLGKDNGNNSTHFLRIKIPGGIVSAEKLHGIADLAEQYGKGYVELTNRQDIQLHWIKPENAIEIFEKMYELGFTTDLCGQAFNETCHGDVRNIVACPLNGKISRDIKVGELNNYFSGNPDFLSLPHKFKIAITACGYDCVRIHANDLSLVWKDEHYIPFVGGGIGQSKPGFRLAKPLGVKVEEGKIFEFVKAVVEIHRDYSNRESKAKARFKNLVEFWGIAKLREKIEEKIGKLRDFGGEANLKLIEHVEGLQNNGLAFCTLPLLGVLNAEKLRKLANLSEEFGSGELRLTPWQNVTFVDVHDVEALKYELANHFEIGNYYKAVACPSNFCGRTIVHARDVLKEVVEYGNVAVSGCLNGCACHYLADVGLVGKIKKEQQFYDLYIKGKFLKSLKPEEIPKIVKRCFYEVET